jgi:hypothetical protein
MKRGTPSFSNDQRTKILELLREAGPRGVKRETLIFAHHFTQCGTRIFELQKMGYDIRSEHRGGDRYVTYVLYGEPQKEKPLPTYLPKGPDPRQGTLANSSDWYEKQTGQKRPGGQPRPFSEKRMAQDDCFALTPPEPRS